MDLKETLKALRALRGRRVLVGAGGGPEDEHPRSLMRVIGARLEPDRKDRTKFLLVLGEAPVTVTVGTFEIPPALFESAEIVEDGLLLITVAGLVVAVVAADAEGGAS